MGRRAGAGRLHGFVVVDKPAGWTSHDVVARMRRLLDERRVGHAGTLDPAATGVLPVAVGQATKSLEFLAEASKTYLAEITLGVTTDSYDGDGRVVETRPVDDLRATELEEAARAFVGPLRQVPPMYSAIKVGGRRLYEFARRGEEVEREPRQVEIYDLRVTDWSAPAATLCVDCSKGTYIRSLAHDFGVALGVGAYLSNLVRLRTGPFSLRDAWTLAELDALDLVEEWPTVAAHPDAGALTLDGLILDHEASRLFGQGRQLTGLHPGERAVRVYDSEGKWLGIAAPAQGGNGWQPTKVIADLA